MQIYAILPEQPNPTLDAQVLAKFEGNNLKLASNQWLVAGAGTASEISHTLGITRLEGDKVLTGPTGTAVVIAMASYFGHAPSNIWEWIKVKLEASP